MTDIDLLTLNIWGGEKSAELADFLHDMRLTRIFCFQEVFSLQQQPKPHYKEGNCPDIFEKISTVLPDHKGVFCPLFQGGYGLAVFVKKDIQIMHHGLHWIYINNDDKCDLVLRSRCLQWLTLSFKKHVFTIFNIHGLVNRQGKLDAAERFEQLANIETFAALHNHPVILAGDFNISLNTDFISKIEDGRINLIKKYNIKSTRSSLYSGHDRYADYIFLPNACKESDFAVKGDVVSDHLALYCNFSFDK